MAEGISPNPLNKITQVYLDRVAKINSNPEIAQKEREKWQTEAKVDTGSAEEKATARNKRNTPPGADSKFDTSVFITRKPGESLDSARTRKRREAAAKKRGVKEALSSWRDDLREIVDEIESDAEKKVEKKNVKNKVVINPILTDAVENMGGQLLEVAEVVDDKDESKEQKAEALKKKEAMLKKRIVRMKMQAVNQGAGENIIAGYEPDIEGAVEYFYEEGINEEGIDLLIAEIGLNEFVDFVDGGAVYLNEERDARKASVRAKSYEKVKAEVDKSDAAKKKAKKGEYAPSYAKKETDVTDYGDDKPAAKKAPAKKPAPKPVVKKAAPKPVAKKVVKAVAKVKPAQPKKPASKQGLRDKIKSAYKAGVKRHKKAVQPARVFGKGFKRGVTDTVKFAKKAKKAVVGEEVIAEKDLNAAERRALPDKEFALPGKGKGPEGKQAGSYPIPDKSHARMALAMVAKHGTPEKKAQVRAAVAKKFPGIQQEAKKNPNNLVEPSDGVDSAKEVNKATRKAAFRPFNKEDRAFDNVVGMLRKKHGESGVLTKDSPKPKAQPRPKAKPDTRTPEQKKKDQDHANVMARYGGEANYKAGRGLGT